MSIERSEQEPLTAPPFPPNRTEISAEEVANFHTLRERLVLRGSLVAQTGLRIGGGDSDELNAVDLPVMRDADGFPFIPGSSLKGAIRATLEALVRGADLPPTSGLWACDPLLEAESDQRNGTGSCGWHRRGRHDAVKLEQHCCICRILGSRAVASHVRFSDLLLQERAWRGRRRLPIELRDGVAIDRDLRTVHNSQKYDFEVVSPGARFTLEVFVDNPSPWAMGLLTVGFDQLHEGFTALGGFTSRGLGRVSLHWDSLERLDARSLLEGKGVEKLNGDDLLERLEKYRQALALVVKEAQHVS
ncbi:MAG: CRISPR-associated RAMP protein Csx7 [Myxococcota bacterium]